MKETSHSPEALAIHRRRVPHDPVVHGPGEVGVSSRWWYLPGMYKPVVSKCHCCDGPAHAGMDEAKSRGRAGCAVLNAGTAKHESGNLIPRVDKTSDLYRIPTYSYCTSDASVSITWPRMDVQSKVFLPKRESGPCFLDFSAEEQKALAIIILVTMFFFHFGKP